MAQQIPNKSGYNPNRGNHREEGYSQRKQKKTTAELANDVINEHFKGVENDLLSLTDITKIKSIFSGLETFTQQISSGLTTSQLRNVYSKILGAETPVELQLLRPNLAYVAARNDKQEAKKVMAFVDYLIQQVDSTEKQKAFNKVLEAMVAYHKYSNTK